MLNRKVASESLYQFNDNQLHKMWQNGEIAKCPVCKRYHDLRQNTFIVYNLEYCDECDKTKKLLESWLDK